MNNTMTFSEQEACRFKRQTILHDWGVTGQEKLKKASVFIAGAGGLGCPVATALALAGVGKLIICDLDHVELSNLNRQFLHGENDIGTAKALSAEHSLTAINSQTEIVPIVAKIGEDTVAELTAGCDIIVDCLDNIDGRRALNAHSVSRGLPMVHGGIWGFEGRVTVFNPPQTPCLACLLKDEIDQEVIPVAGVTAISIGALQATEVLKILLETGKALSNTMLTVSLDSMDFRKLNINKDENCPVCGNKGDTLT